MNGRRLPVYILIDVSGSMEGQPIQAVQSNLEALFDEVAQDRRLAETAYLSVITFANDAQQIVPLSAAGTISLPDLGALTAQHGMTATGDALIKLCECVDAEVQRAHDAHTGDYRPVVVLLTDGRSNKGSLSAGIECMRKRHWGRVILAAAGNDASDEELLSIQGNEKEVYLVVHVESTNAQAIAGFFELVSQSIHRESDIATTGQDPNAGSLPDVLSDPDSGLTLVGVSDEPTMDS